jgi:hypothetical protein
MTGSCATAIERRKGRTMAETRKYGGLTLEEIERGAIRAVRRRRALQDDDIPF